MMPTSAWREAEVRSRSCDVVLINTVRSLRSQLQVPMVVDFVDALSWNMRVRSRGQEPWPVWRYARLEARLLVDWERTVEGWAAASIVTSAGVAQALPNPDRHAVIPVPWVEALVDRDQGARDIDLIMTGDMRYPPNPQGALLLARDISPRRIQRPGTSCWIVGRHAARLDVQEIEVRETFQTSVRTSGARRSQLPLSLDAALPTRSWKRRPTARRWLRNHGPSTPMACGERALVTRRFARPALVSSTAPNSATRECGRRREQYATHDRETRCSLRTGAV